MTRAVAYVVAFALVLAAAPDVAAKKKAKKKATRTAKKTDLDYARTAVDELDYEAARTLLKDALRSGEYGGAEVVAIYRLTGLVEAAFGRTDSATDAFRRMLAIDASATIPRDVAPKIIEPFKRAKRHFAEHASIEVAFTSADGHREAVAVTVQQDPLTMIAGARARYKAGVAPGETVAGSRRMVVPISAAHGVVTIVVLDRFGNRLVEHAWTRRASPSDRDPDLDTDERADRDGSPSSLLVDTPRPTGTTAVYARWYVWGAATVGAAAAATWFGMRASADWGTLDALIEDSELYDFGQARALERSGRRNALISNIGIGTAAVLGAVSTYLFLRGRRERPRRTIQPVPLRGGAAVSLSMEF